MHKFKNIQIYAFKLLERVTVLKLWRKKCAIKSNRLQLLIYIRQNPNMKFHKSQQKERKENNKNGTEEVEGIIFI